MFSTELGFTLEAAFREASQRRHAYFCLEHLLFALLFEESVAEVLKACGAEPDDLKQDLETFFNTKLEKVSENASEVEPIQTPAVQRVLQQAVMHMHSAGKKVVTSRDVLVAMYSEPESHAVFFLEQQEVTRLDIINFISHGISKVGSSEDGGAGTEEGDPSEEGDVDSTRKANKKSMLARFTENLTERARRMQLDPVIGREKEVSRALRVLSRRQKNNPLFLGEAGVGKTALANALALRIVAEEVPESLRDAQMFSLDLSALIAGTKFRGEFEERLKGVVSEISKIKNAILYIDEIHTIVGAGATGSGSMDAANLLRPALAAGSLRCIGSTTHEDYKKSFDKDRALSRRFSVIEVVEPSVAETVEILRGLKSRYEKHHAVHYSEAALEAAAELSAKFIRDRALPDKAIDVLDEAGAANRLLPKDKRRSTIQVREIESVVSAIARTPVKSVSQSEWKVLKGIEDALRAKVYGQDAAVAAVAKAIKRSRANLGQENKPVGCFLFAGPTGVGKTELAKVLAHELGIHFHRFDMSEYMEKHAVARLIGAPPGYVGYEEGGQLTDLVRKHPHAVLLFDELEKAHEDIYNVLLQLMDDAVLTDSHGKKADFRHVVVIMTTNVGSEKAASLGFGQTSANSSRDAAVKRQFKPEFRNRLDEVVYFNPLPIEIAEKIVDKFIIELEAQLKAKKVHIVLDAKARRWLAQNGFDSVLGARPMARIIQREIKDPLADEILFGRLKKGGTVAFSVENEKILIEWR